MRNSDRRISKLAEQFTARERAVLVLRSWKEGRDEDPSWRRSMPEGQAWEFNGLIDLMNGVNNGLMPLLLVLGLEADKLALRLGVLGVLALWYVHAEDSAWLLRHECPKSKLAAGSLTHAPLLPVMHLDDDLKAIVDEATQGVEPSKLDELAVVHKERLREDLQGHRRYLVAAEAVIEEVREEFGGEDPTLPDTRRVFDYARERLDRVREGAARFLGPLDDVELDDVLLAQTRRLVGLAD